jgi:CheY-like chemotaxis protein
MVQRNLESDAIPDFRGKRFLIVDDIEINREICLELFQETGAVMDTAANGQEAFDMFFNHGEYYYDLILMDVKMPVLDGHRATEKIRGSGKKDAQSIKIVAMTANVMQEEIIQTQKAGMNAHIGKPLDISEAFKVIQRLFQP